MSDVNIHSIPLEVLEIILSFLPTVDLLHFSQTCRIFRKNTTSLDSMWMRKTQQEWQDFHVIEKNQPSWFNIFINACETRNFCWEQLKTMNSVSLSDSQLKLFMEKSREYDGLAFVYIIALLKKICLTDVFYPDENCQGRRANLTNQYFSAIILDYLNQNRLKSLWKMYLEEPRMVTPEKVLAFLSGWIEPKYNNSEKFNNEYFASIVKKIEGLLPSNHPFLKIHEKTKEKWAYQLLQDNAFEPEVCRELIKLIREVLKREEELIVSSEPTLSSMIFRNVSPRKNSNNILSLIYFDAILRRVGVKCDPMFFHSHHLLLWRENWTKKTPIFLVDALQDRLNVSERRCPYTNSTPSLDYCYSPTNLLLTLTSHVKNISNFPHRAFKNSVELLHFMQPNEIEHLLLLSNIYLDSERDVTEIFSKYSNVVAGLNVDTKFNWDAILTTMDKFNAINYAKSTAAAAAKTVKIRSKSLKYAIGLVCFHKVYGYYCVILGWDNVCAVSADCKWNMGISSLAFGENQPFYQVLAVDLSSRYVAEENLVVCNPPIRMTDIEEMLALDFSHFNGYYYIPTAEKEKEYPADTPIRLKYRENWK